MSDGVRDVTGIPILRQNKDTRHIVDTPADCWFIYEVHHSLLRHDSYDRELIIIFAANHSVSGQMVKYQYPDTAGNIEPMRGLQL